MQRLRLLKEGTIKENPDNKEASTEKTEKRHNQILEGAYDYKDEFESKVENSEGKEAQDTKENQKKSDGSEKPKMFERIKDFFSKEKVKEADKTDKAEEADNHKTAKERSREFRDSYKYDVEQKAYEEPVKKTETNNEGESKGEREKTLDDQR